MKTLKDFILFELLMLVVFFLVGTFIYILLYNFCPCENSLLIISVSFGSTFIIRSIQDYINFREGSWK